VLSTPLSGGAQVLGARSVFRWGQAEPPTPARAGGAVRRLVRVRTHLPRPPRTQSQSGGEASTRSRGFPAFSPVRTHADAGPGARSISPLSPARACVCRAARARPSVTDARAGGWSMHAWERSGETDRWALAPGLEPWRGGRPGSGSRGVAHQLGAAASVPSRWCCHHTRWRSVSRSACVCDVSICLGSGSGAARAVRSFF